MFEQLIIVGNLGNDPELYDLESGSTVCRFSVATSKKFYNQQEELQEQTKWWNISVWGKQAEHCAKYLSKGRKVMVQGEVTAFGYQAKDSNEIRGTLQVRAYKVMFLSSRHDNDGDGEDDYEPSTEQPKEKPKFRKRETKAAPRKTQPAASAPLPPPPAAPASVKEDDDVMRNFNYDDDEEDGDIPF